MSTRGRRVIAGGAMRKRGRCLILTKRKSTQPHLPPEFREGLS